MLCAIHVLECILDVLENNLTLGDSKGFLYVFTQDSNRSPVMKKETPYSYRLMFVQLKASFDPF